METGRIDMPFPATTNKVFHPEKVLTVYNLADDRELVFMADIDPVYAVVYARFDELGILRQLFDHLQAGTFADLAAALPITRGAHSVALGDWAASTRWKESVS